jgi:hypothetical protein
MPTSICFQKTTRRPAPLWSGLCKSGLLPVSNNVPAGIPWSTIRLVFSQMGGNLCHSSINTGDATSRIDSGEFAIIWNWSSSSR